MNPKTPQDLDPKLKEAYDRVMGGNFTPSAPAAPAAPVSAPNVEAAPPLTVSPMPSAAPLPNPTIATQPLSVMSPTSSAQNVNETGAGKKKSKLSPKIFLIIGIVFFIVYALVWGKFFKLF